MDTLVITPTYNECRNVEPFATQVLRANPGCGILFVDDASPDGTGLLINKLAEGNSQISVLHRTNKAGIGPAYLAGFHEALHSPRHQGAQYICEMDADLSHPPLRLAALVAACRDGADVAIGSRWVAGGATEQWGLGRQLLSRAGSLYARTLLGLPLRDLTAGFVCYRRAALQKILAFAIESNGYCFQIEMKARAHQLGLSMRELPIVFHDRQAGQSKMNAGIALEAISKVWHLRKAVRKAVRKGMA